MDFLTPEDYTVAWVCALPLEAVAARVMLDTIHPRPQRVDDPHAYEFGELNGHHVVLAYLPYGVYGTVSAAAVVSRMRLTFPRLQFALMVGIGGGVPSQSHDIRLGDVVVSKPGGGHTGVIQYNYGKAVQGGQFECTGTLNQPPQALLTHLSQLEAKQMSAGANTLSSIVSEALERNPIINERFSAPEQHTDRLFHSSYSHVDSGSDCGRCDEGHLVKRQQRDRKAPYVHYGLIASGDHVMKDSETRDRLAKQYGVLCFEMEAAGLMNELPTLVIRGICDYCDSHKQKQWQRYAALTAAAYTKELLSAIHPTHLAIMPSHVQTRQLSRLFRQARNGQIINRESGYMDEERILQRLSNYDHERVHQRLSRKRLMGTTEWFLKHPDYKAWLAEERSPYLCCFGKIGSGKTLIATGVVDDTRTRLSNGPTVFYYCDEQDETHQGFSALSSFIKQLYSLLWASRSWPGSTREIVHRFYGNSRVGPDFEDLKDIFTELFMHIPHTTYILDGLDFLGQHHCKGILELFRSLLCGRQETKGSRIIFFTRDQIPGYLNIGTLFPGIRTISTTLNVKQDIEKFVEVGIIEKSIYRKLTNDAQLMEEVSKTLLRESSGMFLWVFLQLEILWETCFSDLEIRSALADLPKDLEETYRRCCARIHWKDPRVTKVLRWVSFSSRPLHIQELREAIAFEIHDTAWAAEKIPQMEFVIGCCSNLVVMDSTDGCVRFAHSSVWQYLEGYSRQNNLVYPENSSQGELACGEFCVAYLAFADFSLQLERTQTRPVRVVNPVLLAGNALGVRLDTFIFRGGSSARKPSHQLPFKTIRTVSTPDPSKYSFLDYAIANWARQTRQISLKSPVWHQFEQLATSFNHTWNFHPWISGGRSKRSHIHGLFGWAVTQQHQPLLSIVLAWRREVQEICDAPLIEEGLPALHLASKLGYYEMAKELAQICNVNALDQFYNTPLHYAGGLDHTYHAREAIARLLIDHGANVDARGMARQTPLHEAASAGNFATAELLLEKGADLDSRDKHGFTPLFFADETVAQLLLERGADIDITSDGISPFWLAVNSSSETGGSLPRLFLEEGLKRHYPVEDKKVSLIRAVCDGEVGEVMALLQQGAKPDSHDRWDVTPLFWAAFYGRDEVVKLLLDYEVDVNIANRDGRTALFQASFRGFDQVVKLLLQKGANPERRDRWGDTAEHWATQNGHQVVVALFREHRKTRWLRTRNFEMQNATFKL